MTLPACLAATGWDWLSLYACNADQVKLLLCKSRRKTRAMNTTQTTYGQNSPQLTSPMVIAGCGWVGRGGFTGCVLILF